MKKEVKSQSVEIFKMRFTKKYDWMFRKMLANIPVSDIARSTFKDWWKQLGQIVDESFKQQLQKCEKEKPS